MACFSQKLKNYLLLSEEELNALSLKDTTELTKAINNKIKFYEDEISKYDELFKNLKIMNDDGTFLEDLDQNADLDKLCEMQEYFEVTNLNIQSIILSFITKQEKRIELNTILSKIKACTKIYVEWNAKLSETIKKLVQNENISTHELQSICLSNEEILILKNKMNQYKEVLGKLENEHSSVRKTNIQSCEIMSEINVLLEIMQEEEKLLKKLSVYKGLEPNIVKATEQLNELKKENEELKRKLCSNL